MSKQLLFSIFSVVLLTQFETLSDTGLQLTTPNTAEAKTSKKGKKNPNSNKEQIKALELELKSLQTEKQHLINGLIDNLMEQAEITIYEKEHPAILRPSNFSSYRNRRRNYHRPTLESIVTDKITDIKNDISTLQKLSKGGSYDIVALFRKNYA